MTEPHPHKPATTLPYIHCPHCGNLIIGVVKSDTTSAEVLDELEHRAKEFKTAGYRVFSVGVDEITELRQQKEREQG
jgi:hypothetical protein